MRLGLAALIVLALSCQPRSPNTAADAKRAFCSGPSVVAVDTSCKAAIFAVDQEQRQLVLDACETLIDAQALTCGDAR